MVAKKKGGTQSAEPQPQDASVDAERGGGFPIVGLGASAGGLGALTTFFSHMPAESGLAFVVITHQHGSQPSLLAQLLGRETHMPVVQVDKSTVVEPNHVYTSPPGFNLAILGGVLQPMEIDDSIPLNLPIDYFFRSLARDQKERAIGVVLSGTGSDGSIGLKEIKGALGMVMVQDEHSAQYAGMPHSAIATEMVDYVLPVSELPGQLLAYVNASRPRGARSVAEATAPFENLQQVFVLIRDRTGHDFSQYKASTVGRRIDRRMHVHRLDTLKRYVRYLQTNPSEVDLLVKELLIGVTSFFRDPEAWQALAAPLSALLADKPDDYVVRGWVAGCATGEEAYSLAILLREAMDAAKRTLDVQIFATDLDARAIEAARVGAYPAGIAADLSPQRLAHFFTRHDDTYRVNQDIRELLVFAPQNVITEPPFTKLDVVTCRNLLIYLEPGLQQRLLPIFHYALKPGGLMLLGSSETLGACAELFSNVDKKWKIFRRAEGAVRTHAATFPASATPKGRAAGLPPLDGRIAAAPIDKAAARMLLAEMVPPTVVVHERGDVAYLHGRCGHFLEPAQGSQAKANIFNMAREGLQVGLATALRRAAESGSEIVQGGVQVKTNGDLLSVDVRVKRITAPESLRGLFRVSFVDARPLVQPGPVDGDGDDSAASDRGGALERELRYSKESHQSTIEELETAHQELTRANEELQSTNEELQSANEELESSKEEMQSLNEELQTVNVELQGKVEELSRANNDMKNLLDATNIAILFLDNELRINRYTEQAKQVIRLIPSDIGRSIGDLSSTLRYDRLVDDAREVLRTLAWKEAEVEGENDTCYLMRMLPYRTTDNVIEGLVLTFIDITKFKTLRVKDATLVTPQ